MENLGWLFKPAELEGTIGDLLGQQFVIYILLFILVISLIFLFTSYVINIFIFINKDKILKKFKNKWIIYYIKYQSFIIKISLIYIPIFIFIGLFILLIVIHFLLTHFIPIEELGISLDTPIGNSKLNINKN